MQGWQLNKIRMIRFQSKTDIESQFCLFLPDFAIDKMTDQMTHRNER